MRNIQIVKVDLPMPRIIAKVIKYVMLAIITGCCIQSALIVTACCLLLWRTLSDVCLRQVCAVVVCQLRQVLTDHIKAPDHGSTRCRRH